MANLPAPKRGEIWLVNFDPSVGAEIQKLRPALVVNVDSVGRLPLRLVAPVTDWKPQYAGFPWLVFFAASAANGLRKHSAADAFQTKSVSVNRFSHRLGSVTAAEADPVATAIALCVGTP